MAGALRQVEPQDSLILRENMRRASRIDPLDEITGGQAHHIVPVNDIATYDPDLAARFDDYLRDRGIDINDEANGIILVTGVDTPNPNVTVRHEFTFARRGGPSGPVEGSFVQYVDVLERELLTNRPDATRDEVRQVLRAVADSLADGQFPPRVNL
jgi:hypothetical protein